MAEEGRKIQARRVTAETFGELARIEVDTPQDVDFAAMVIRLDPKDEDELYRLIELGGGPLAWGKPSPSGTLWHRSSTPGGGDARASVYIQFPQQPREPVIDPLVGGVMEKQQRAEEEARRILTDELESRWSGSASEGDVPRAVEALIRRGWKPGDDLKAEMVEDAMTIRPVS